MLSTRMSAPNCNETWEETLLRRLPYLGHRNWIVVADAAYPQQTSPGIQTILAEGGVADAVTIVLETVRSSSHVRPIIYLDKELAALPVRHAAGIETVRIRLAAATAGLSVRQLPHDEIIAKLDAAGRNFHVLLIKTRETLPYTSVFIELDCGYWSSEAEQDLRTTMKSPPNL